MLPELKKVLKPIKRRLMAEEWLKWLVLFEAAAMGCCLAVSIASKFIFISDLERCFVIFIVLGLLLSVIVGYLRRPDYYKAAEQGDRMGNKERFVTAYEILSEQREQGVMEALVVKDAVVQGKTIPGYKISLPKRGLFALGVLLLATVTTGFLPSPANIDAPKLVQSNLKAVEEIIKEAKEEEFLDKDVIKKIEKEKNSLTKELKKAITRKDGVKAIQQTQQELKKLEKESQNKSLEEVGKAMAQSGPGQELGNALEQGDEQKAKEYLDELKNRLETMPQEEKEEWIDTFSQSAEAVTDSSMKEMLGELAESMESGNFAQARENLDRLAKLAESTAQNNANITKVVEQVNQELAEASSTLQGENSTNQEPQSSGQGQQEASGQGGGQGQGEGQGRCV